jgi:hypothetical protein
MPYCGSFLLCEQNEPQKKIKYRLELGTLKIVLAPFNKVRDPICSNNIGGALQARGRGSKPRLHHAGGQSPTSKEVRNG